MWWMIGIVGVVLAIASVASAETFKYARREEGESWQGKKDPPEDMKPRPKFRVGETVIDTSTGKKKSRTITEISGYRGKGKGQWAWTYYMTDGSIAAESALLKN